VVASTTFSTKETGALDGMATSNDGWLHLFVVAGGGDGGTDGTFFD
jgi:hypothetical protein